MSTPPPEDCIFCRIVAGTVPSRQVYADEHAVLRRSVPGSVKRVRLQSVPSAADGLAVHDAFFTDLATIDNIDRQLMTYQAHCAVAHASDLWSIFAELSGRQLGVTGHLANGFLDFVHGVCC